MRARPFGRARFYRKDMFRELTRIKQKLPLSECKEVLRTTLRGTLAVNGDEGYPYALPINHYYDKATHTLFFHSGKAGYKIDCITRSGKACFTVTDEGERRENEWWLTFRSVIAFGKITAVQDAQTIERISRALSHKFTQDEGYIDHEIEKYAPATLLLALEIEDVKGKIVREK